MSKEKKSEDVNELAEEADEKAQVEEVAHEEPETDVFLVSREIKIPVKEIVCRVATGGNFINENGLIYAAKYTSQQDFMIVTVGYEYQKSGPQVNFFNFDLIESKHAETGELIDKSPAIQSPVPQHFISDFPMIAYKSFMSDNSEIVLSNTAQKGQPQHILKMTHWRFICFVDHAMMKEMIEVDRFDCNILYIAQHYIMHKFRLFAIRCNPWVKDAEQQGFGVVDCFPTVPFELPDLRVSMLKKVELITQHDENRMLQLALVF